MIFGLILFSISIALLIGIKIHEIKQQKKILEEKKLSIENKRISYLGKKISNRYEAVQAMQDLLTPIADIGREGLVIIGLDNLNTIIDVNIRIGEAFSVQCASSEIVDFAMANKSNKIVLGHNHPILSAVPSDADVSHCASLYLLARERGITLLDDLVLCGNQLKSILNTQRFKQMVREY